MEYSKRKQPQILTEIIDWWKPFLSAGIFEEIPPDWSSYELTRDFGNFHVIVIPIYI